MDQTAALPAHPICGKRNSYVVCRRAAGHDGLHGAEIDGHWFNFSDSGHWGTCNANHPTRHVYCGLEKDHEDEHLAASCLGMILAAWK